MSISSAMLKPLTLQILTNYGKLLEMGIPDHLTCLLRNLYVGEEVTELCMEQLIGLRWRTEYHRAVCCHPVCLTYTLTIS